MTTTPLPTIQSPPEYCEYAAGPCDQIFSGVVIAAGVFLYPARPTQIAATIESAIDQMRRRTTGQVWRSWREFATTGQIIFCAISKSIRFSEAVIADVTSLNFNVLFEIGYTIGLEQPVIPIRDTTIITNDEDFRALGLLDTLGYLDFQNSEGLAQALLARLPAERFHRLRSS